MADLKYTSLKASTSAFSDLMKKFAVVTVMNAKVYDTAEVLGDGKTFDQIAAAESDTGNAQGILDTFLKANPVCKLDTLKVANVTIEGPTKSITGGRYADTLIKYGKTATMEIQDALGSAAAIEALCGGLQESSAASNGTLGALHIGSDFSSTKTIIGDTFFLDENGQQVKVYIIFYQFVPDSLFNLTQDAEGDATVFDMNGTLKTTEIKVSTATDSTSISHGVFYSILPYTEKTTTTD